MLSLFEPLPLSGSFCLGFILGWLIYYINRHRAGPVSLADLGVIVSVIAGGAVTGLLKIEGVPNAEMFGAYGIGLLVGFLSYLAILIVLVKSSGGEYDMLYFLDGRRKRPDPKYDVPPIGEVRPMILFSPGSGESHGRQTADQFGGFRQHRTPTAMPTFPSVTATPTTITEAQEKLEAAVVAIYDAINELDEKRSVEPDDRKADQMGEQITTLNFKADVLETEISKMNFNRPKVIAAHLRLIAHAKDVSDEAEKIKQVGDTIEKATKLISLADKAISLVTGLI